MNTTEKIIKECIDKSCSLYDFWIHFVNLTQVSKLAEIGVLKGNYAEKSFQIVILFKPIT